MDKENKNRLKQQIQALRSNNRTAILDTLKELRTEGDISILPELFNLLLIQEDEEIHSDISTLLNDLKDKSAAEVLAEAIANSEYKPIQTELVAACWQNGLSYGKHINTFVDVLISGDYSAAIEAFTVIEEAIGELESKERMELVHSLKSIVQKVDEQKKALFVELVKVIESY